MAKDKIADYDASAAGNTDIGGIGIQGTNLPSNFDNAFREIMSQLKDADAGTSPLTDTWSFCDPADRTKIFRFDGVGISTATTRVITMPNANGTMFLVGDYGVGASSATQLTASNALDSVTTTQFNAVATANVATVNGPSGASGGAVLTIRYDSDNAAQIYYQITGSTRVWNRYRTSAGWFTWREVYTTQSLLGTVSQSGGIPTGALIERGSNANGEYARFADGTLICTRTVSVGAPNNAAGSIFAATSTDFTFASSFTATPSCAVSCTSGHATIWGGLGSTSLSSTGGSAIAFRAVTGASSITANVVAVGRWF